jgi:hypothetical protein
MKHSDHTGNLKEVRHNQAKHVAGMQEDELTVGEMHDIIDNHGRDRDHVRESVGSLINYHRPSS